jgi:hypothetical protein
MQVMGKVMNVRAGLRPEEYAAVVERAFARCPPFRGLRFLSAEARQGSLTVQFEGPLDDFRGPYGIAVDLPPNLQEELAAGHGGADEKSAEDWVHAAVALRALEAHAASQDQDRPYSPDGVWWIIKSTATD